MDQPWAAKQLVLEALFLLQLLHWYTKLLSLEFVFFFYSNNNAFTIKIFIGTTSHGTDGLRICWFLALSTAAAFIVISYFTRSKYRK